jgi:hypothetical protein
MPTETQFAERLLEQLSLDESHLPSIESAVRRYAKKLLRDYNFPKSIATETFIPAALQQEYTLPTGWKKILQVYFKDITDPAAPTYGDPLGRTEGFRRPREDGIPEYFWIAGTSLWTDIQVPAADYATTRLIVLYQSGDIDSNIDWMLEDFEDILHTLAMFRLSSEHNKTELAAIWAVLWQEDMRALAIYANELEFEDYRMYMKVAGSDRRRQRYPIAADGSY